MTTDQDQSEQRRAKRFSVQASVEFAQGRGFSHDISTTGLYFLTEYLFRLHEKVLLIIRPAHSPSIRCTGEVVRIEKTEAQGYGIAVFFTDLLFEPTLSH